MRVLYETMKIVMIHLQECELNAFAVKSKELVGEKCVPLLKSYTSDSSACKDMSKVRDGVVMQKPYVTGKLI